MADSAGSGFDFDCFIMRLYVFGESGAPGGDFAQQFRADEAFPKCDNGLTHGADSEHSAD